MKNNKEITEQGYVPMINEFPLEKLEKQYQNFQNELDNEKNFEDKCKIALKMLLLYDFEPYTAIWSTKRKELGKILYPLTITTETRDQYKKFLKLTRISKWEENQLKEMDLKLDEELQKKLEEENKLKQEEELRKKLEEEENKRKLEEESKRQEQLNKQLEEEKLKLQEELRMPVLSEVLNLNINKANPSELLKIQSFLNKQDLTLSKELLEKYIKILNAIHKNISDPWEKFLTFYCVLNECKNPDIKRGLQKELNKRAKAFLEAEHFENIFLRPWTNLRNKKGQIIWSKFGKINDETLKKSLEKVIFNLSIKSKTDQYIDYFLFEPFFIPEDSNNLNILNKIFEAKENKKHILANFNLAFDFCIQNRDYVNADGILGLTRLNAGKIEDTINSIFSNLNQLLKIWRSLSEKYLKSDLFCLNEKNIQRIRKSIDESNSDKKINDLFLLNTIIYETRMFVSKTNNEDARTEIKFFQSGIANVEDPSVAVVYSAIAYRFGLISIANELAKIAGVTEEFMYEKGISDKKTPAKYSDYKELIEIYLKEGDFGNAETIFYELKKFYTQPEKSAEVLPSQKIHNKFCKDIDDKIVDLKETEKTFKSLIEDMNKIKEAPLKLNEISKLYDSFCQDPSAQKYDEFISYIDSITADYPWIKEKADEFIPQATHHLIVVFIDNKDKKEYQLTDEKYEKIFKNVDFLLFSREELSEMLTMFNRIGDKCHKNYLSAANFIAAYDTCNKKDQLSKNEYQETGGNLGWITALSTFCVLKKCKIVSVQQVLKNHLSFHIGILLSENHKNCRLVFIENFSNLFDEKGKIKWEEKFGEIKNEPLKKELESILYDLSDTKQSAEYGVGSFGYLNDFLGSVFLTDIQLIKLSTYKSYQEFDTAFNYFIDTKNYKAAQAVCDQAFPSKNVSTKQLINNLLKNWNNLSSIYLEGKPFIFNKKNVETIKKGILTRQKTEGDKLYMLYTLNFSHSTLHKLYATYQDNPLGFGSILEEVINKKSVSVEQKLMLAQMANAFGLDTLAENLLRDVGISDSSDKTETTYDIKKIETAQKSLEDFYDKLFDIPKAPPTIEKFKFFFDSKNKENNKVIANVNNNNEKTDFVLTN